MCKTCAFIEAVFEAARTDPHPNYLPVLVLLFDLLRQERIELVAGDCPAEEVADVLAAERHYTVSHYFRCTNCGQHLFIGACIRGTPIYRIPMALDTTSLMNMLWGNVGTLFTRPV